MKFRNKLIKGIAISMAFTTMLTSTAFATPIDLRDSVLDVQYDSLNQNIGTTYYTNENNEWTNGTINEEVKVTVDLASQFDITIPKDIVLDGETGKASYVINAKGDIAGDQVLVVEPENEFLLSEKGGKTDITATVTQENTEYTYTELQGTGTDYNGVVQAQLSAGEWYGKFNFNIKFKAQGLPEKGLPLENYSWSEIAAISEAGEAENYFSVGDTKEVEINGQTYNMGIIGFNHDDLADRSGKAGITFQMVEVYADEHVINTANTNVGGWEASKMRTYLQNDFKALLPVELTNEIKVVNKVSDARSGNNTTLITTQDDLFLLSLEEVGLSSSYNIAGQGTKYAAFSDKASRIKNKSGFAADWWLRSASSYSSNAFFYITSGGNVYNGGVNSSHGVAPAFCI